jgi:hypothetical protein
MAPTYVTTLKGKKISVILSMSDYKKLIEAKEELEDIRLYDAVKSKHEPRVSLDHYLKKRKQAKNAAI